MGECGKKATIQYSITDVLCVINQIHLDSIKKGFESSLLNNVRKAVDDFRSITVVMCLDAKQRVIKQINISSHIRRGYSAQ